MKTTVNSIDVARLAGVPHHVVAQARQALELAESGRAACLLSGGETTVTIHGSGKGGRNQEMALAAAMALDGWSGVTVFTLATDGTDGPTDLAADDIPVVAPWRGRDGRSLFQHAGYRFALFPRRGGRAPEPGDLDQLEWIGRFIGRIHLAGQSEHFAHRPSLDTKTLGWPARDAVLDSPLLPSELAGRYRALSAEMLALPGETVVYCVNDTAKQPLMDAGAEVFKVAGLFFSE